MWVARLPKIEKEKQKDKPQIERRIVRCEAADGEGGADHVGFAMNFKFARCQDKLHSSKIRFPFVVCFCECVCVVCFCFAFCFGNKSKERNQFNCRRCGLFRSVSDSGCVCLLSDQLDAD